ncbi:uncharacterized protein LOC120351653 [Nilaparvata lugens]|uniref:uncharacterized protein LOC120351653 n=1 Tax=Nilaparvata lugens TaxID=108931 RepID=UPI00193D62A0|nr:uncharacterized protein LOC120351653 [Nilaparvata lugens]
MTMVYICEVHVIMAVKEDRSIALPILCLPHKIADTDSTGLKSWRLNTFIQRKEANLVAIMHLPMILPNSWKMSLSTDLTLMIIFSWTLCTGLISAVSSLRLMR